MPSTERTTRKQVAKIKPWVKLKVSSSAWYKRCVVAPGNPVLNGELEYKGNGKCGIIELKTKNAKAEAGQSKQTFKENCLHFKWSEQREQVRH